MICETLKLSTPLTRQQQLPVTALPKVTLCTLERSERPLSPLRMFVCPYVMALINLKAYKVLVDLITVKSEYVKHFGITFFSNTFHFLSFVGVK